MNDDHTRIFVVDDAAAMRLIVSDQLAGNGYQIHEFESGHTCLAALDLSPHLIILDIDMPGKNGIETCRELRAAGHDEVQVLFFSASDDLETRLLAFDAGGNDFIHKHAEKALLIRKVAIAVEAEEKKQGLVRQLSYTRQAAFTAMSSLGEMGVVLQFLRTSFQCRDVRQLAAALMEAVEQYGLTGLVKLQGACGVSYRNMQSECTELEISILSYINRLGRIYQSADRMGINYPHVTLLVSGLDLEDPDRVGRLRDHLAILAEGADVRISALEEEMQRASQSRSIIEAVKEMTGLLDDIESSQNSNHHRLLDAMDSFRQDLDQSFVHLGLTDKQEMLIHGIVENLNQELAQLFEADQHLAKRLNQIVLKQKKIVALN